MTPRSKGLSAHQRRLERRRLKAATLFREGASQSEVARALKVSYQSVHEWHRVWKKRGVRGLRSKGAPGPHRRLADADTHRLERVLLKGPEAHGFSTPVWTLDRIRTVMHRTTGVRYHPGHVWKVLHGMGWTCQKPKTVARERNEREIRRWLAETWPSLKKGEVTILA